MSPGPSAQLTRIHAGSRSPAPPAGPRDAADDTGNGPTPARLHRLQCLPTMKHASLDLKAQSVAVTVRSMLTFACILCMKLVRLVISKFTRLTVSSMLLTYSPRPPRLLMSSLTFFVESWGINPKRMCASQEVKGATTVHGV